MLLFKNRALYLQVLRADGLLLLKMIDNHAGGLIARDVAINLWKRHYLTIVQ